MPLWATPPNPAIALAKLLRKIIKFHESEPLLMQAPSDKFQFHTENGQKRTDSLDAVNASPPQNQPTPGQTRSTPPDVDARTDFHTENGQKRTDSPKPDWEAQAELFRLEEWALHVQIMRAAESVVEQMRHHPRRVSLSQVANVFLLASKLGRRACGLPIDGTPVETQGPPPVDLEFEEALKRAYPDPEPETTRAGSGGQEDNYDI